MFFEENTQKLKFIQNLLAIYFKIVYFHTN